MFRGVARSSFKVFGGVRYNATSTANYDVVIVGGGSAGMSLLNNWINHPSASVDKSGDKFTFAIVEPSSKHYYQPLWTLVGGGVVKNASDSEGDTKDLIPKNAKWFQDKVVTIDPNKNEVNLEKGEKIGYKALVVAAGLQVNFDKIKGLPEALENPNAPVCSNYSYKYCQKTARTVKLFEGGDAYFTFPTGPVKCAGAPQKIMYLAHSAWKDDNVSANIFFNTAIGKMFAVEKYRAALDKLCAEKNITRNFGHNLIEVNGEEKKAVFKLIPEIAGADCDDTVTVDFDFLHATPPMGPPDFLKETGLVDASGFVSVKKETLQHTEFPNVFSLGDCSNVPTSKTASAVAGQLGIARFRAGKFLGSQESVTPKPEDFSQFIEGDGPIYDGYTSCPLPVGEGKGIIAEFNFDAEPQETTFWDQSVPSRANYFLKAGILPTLYWDFFVKGKWEGPWAMRKRLNPKGN